MKHDRGWICALTLTAFLSVGISSEEKITQKENALQNSFQNASTIVDYRLPSNIKPKSYEIMLQLPLDENLVVFSGIVKINATVVFKTNKVIFHAGNLSNIEVAIVQAGRKIPIKSEAHSPVTEKYSIELTEILPKESHIVIAITYQGRLRNDMNGFYRSSYIDDAGKVRWLAATQFQATYARYAFPCFDEPSFKATFVVRIQRPSNYTCLSNMQRHETKATSNLTWDVFETSISMSTYLVAFVVSDFAYHQNIEGNFKVWSRSNAINQTELALKMGPKTLDLLGELFNQPYQLLKMDMVAVPDFSAGAMENWGLITYRESRMLYDEEESSVSAEQDVASIIVHECVHMWFGNLVTPEWWNYLWLSEAFARYYQYIATAKLEPTWKMEQQFIVEQLQTVFATDALESSNPMTKNVSSQSEVGTTGDVITYAKGASIVRMMDLSFGSKIFNSAIRMYLENNKWSSTTPEHLWSELQRQCDENGLQLNATVKTIMDTWTIQPGFPVLSVNITKGIAKLSQQQFTFRNNKVNASNSTWWIPVTWTTQKYPNFTATKPNYWLGNKSDEIQVNVDIDDWIVFNLQESGYYRVNYDKNSWNRIIDVLTNEHYKDIHEVNRAAIVDDLLNLARAGLLDYDTALTGLNYIKRETNYLPFKAAFAGLDYITKRFAGHENFQYISNFSLSIVEYVYNDLGFEDKTNDDRFKILLRKELNIWACSFDHSLCVNKSLYYFDQWRSKNLRIPKNQRPAAYCTAIRHGSSDDWNFLWQQYTKSNYAADKLVILKGLGCSQNQTILEKYLLLALTEFETSGIRLQDSLSVFSFVHGSGQFGAEYILDFVTKHHSAIAKYHDGYDAIASILYGASQRFTTEEHIDKFQNLVNEFNAMEFKTISQCLNNSLELANYELQWMKNNQKAIIAWMTKNMKGDPNESFETTNTTDYRLPKSIVPKSYEIKLTPYIEPGKFTFDGDVKITATVAEATNKIVLHIDEIELMGISVTADGVHRKIESYNDTINVYNFLTITLTEIVKVNATLTIEIIYTGKLNTVMRGFYRSSYVNNAGETVWLAATHLEPVGARKMFPCFDEPALKATFVVSVMRLAKYKAISNTPLKSSSAAVDGRVLDTFEQTPVMSTYLVALIVSDFAYLADVNKNSVWARPNAINQAEYALSVMAPLVKFFENVLGHPYQLPKLDMAALPDFASGAMENWGLLTYRESNMLYDKNNSPITSKQIIADVISHEISHQWFGDQVSPRWWKYLWLSEGFARYFQYHGTAHVETKWGLESQFVVEQLHTSFISDSLNTTHPMTHDVYSPTEISNIFDSISYAKSGSILRMVEKIFGSSLFYDALHDYLAARAYQDATPEHLYEAFQNKVDTTGVKLDAPVATIMDTWTTQSGYPVVTVSIVDGSASLSQERYLRTSLNNVFVDINPPIWWIPITWTSKSKPDFMTTTPKYWLSDKEGSVTLNVSDEWVIFNVQQSGYYRVNYDVASWNRIIDVLKSKDFETIHEVNRASLLDDLLSFGQSGHVDYGTVLSATQYLRAETNYIPWRAAFNGLAFLNARLNGTELYKLYKTHILTILLPMYKKLGHEEVDTEPHYDKLLRIYVVRWACELEVEDCISSSLQYFADWKSDNSNLVPVNIRSTVYCTAIKHGSLENWQFLWDRFTVTDVTTEKQVILKALGCSNNIEVLDMFLMKAITNNSGIRLQDSTSVFAAVYNSGSLGAEYTLDFVERYYPKMYNYYKDYSKIGSILSGISSSFTTEEQVRKFEKFVEANQRYLPEIESFLQSSLTRARDELTWYKKYSPRIYEWLDKTYPSEDYRLSKKLKPINYDIYLTPYLDENNFTFDGEIRINMEVLENTTSIVLLANELTINNVIVYIDSVNSLNVSSYTLNETTHKFSIYLSTIVKAGSKLSALITYTGILNDKMKGFYRSSYTDINGTTRWLASTQFEPVHARQAFPCFDEPSFKAKFNIHIERPNEYKTLSNMQWAASLESEDKTNWTWDSYEETKIMSSYLIAFVVSDFQALNNSNENFNLWARADMAKHGAYALEVGQKVLRYLENITGIDYPISKMDFVAVPDFAGGAMENWGLITFREYGLLYHENVTSATYKKYLTTVVAHELVHMWFGNLVTCEWWDYVWLHEGFAEYLQWIASDFVEPKWKLLQQFVVYELQVAMETDASPTIHPMNNNVTKPTAIANSFDKVAYGKSASVIRMMHHVFGASVFEPALRTYLEVNKYGNANPDHLWSAIQTHEDIENSLGDLNVTIKTVMDSWTNQAGYPVVNASWKAGSLILSQQRFLLSKPKSSDQLDNLYWVPISITTKKTLNFTNTRPSFGFSTKSVQKPMSLYEDDWFIINIQESGYYRVNYDEPFWKRLIYALQAKDFDGIHVINRAQIIDDLLNLARTDYVNYDIALTATKYLQKEQNHLPWKAFFNGISFINQRFDGQETIGEEFAEFVLSLTENIYERIINVIEETDDQLEELNRQLILSWVCKLGHSGCIEDSKLAFNVWRKDEDKRIPPNDRSAVYCTAIKAGDHDDWEFLWNEYEKTDFSSEKVVILSALGCSRNTTTLNKYLNRAISKDNTIRDQDVGTTFASVYSADKFGVDVALEYLITNYKSVHEYYGSWSNVASLFSNVAVRISTEEQINKLELFVNKTIIELTEISSSLQTSIDVAKNNMEWYNSHFQSIRSWLVNKPPETSPGGGGGGGGGESGNGSSNSGNVNGITISSLLRGLFLLITLLSY